MSKIIGNTVGTPNPRPDWNQTDETKADYIKNKPEKATVIDKTSTNEQYSTAKAVYDLFSTFESSSGGETQIPENVETIDNKVTTIDENSTDEQYPTAKAVYNKFSSVINMSKSSNYLNPEEIEVGRYMLTTGVSGNNSQYNLTGYISVKAGEVLTIQRTRNWGTRDVREVAGFIYLTAFDENKIVLPDYGVTNTNPYIVPEGVCFIRGTYSVSDNYIDYAVCKTSEIIAYEEYYTKEKLRNEMLDEEYIKGICEEVADGNAPDSAVDFETPYLSTSGSLTDGEYLYLADNLDVQKNINEMFFAKFTEWENNASLTVGHGETEFMATYVVIDTTNITVYYYNGNILKQEAHGLTFTDFISVNIVVNKEKADITVVTAEGSYTLSDTIWYGCNGKIYAKSGGLDLTDCRLLWTSADLLKDVWIFGDSYLNLTDRTRFLYYVANQGYEDWLACGYGGASALSQYSAFVQLLNFGTPKYAVWTLGMNNPDDGVINESYKTYTENFISKCEENNIIPIISTIPSCWGATSGDSDITLTRDNSYKNLWVKSSGCRYIDFADAVEMASGGWYDDMLSSDGIHPTARGAVALAHRFIRDFPEIVTCKQDRCNESNNTEIPDNVEITDNKVTVIDETVTDNQYPSAKAVYNAISNINTSNNDTSLNITQVEFIPIAGSTDVGKVIQYIGEEAQEEDFLALGIPGFPNNVVPPIDTFIYNQGDFAIGAITYSASSATVAEVTSETEGKYYRYDGLKYIEVNLPDEYNERDTYYTINYEQPNYYWKPIQSQLVSGENIKTINGQSILGSGDIVIEGGNGSDVDIVTEVNPSQNHTNEQVYGALAMDEALLTLDDGLQDKQNTLVSGENIKTINGVSLLGSGNIVIEGVETDGESSDVSGLRAELKTSIGETTYNKDITNTLQKIEGQYYNKDNGNLTTYTGAECTELFAVNEGEKYFVSGSYGYFCGLIVEFDESKAFIRGVGVAESNTNTPDGGYEYTVPAGVSYIGCSTRRTVDYGGSGYKDVVVLKEVTEYNNIPNLLDELEAKHNEDISRTEQKIEEDIVALDEKITLTVENICPNSDFADTSVWELGNTATTMTVENNVATLTNDGSGTQTRIRMPLNGIIPQDHIVYVQASIKSSPNAIWESFNFYTDASYNFVHEKPSLKNSKSLFNDYYGTFDFSQTSTSSVKLWITSTYNIAANAKDQVTQIKNVFICDLTESFGAGNEPSASEFYNILKAGGSWFKGSKQIFMVDLIKPTLPIVSDYVITVGANGDCQTINEAIEKASSVYPVYKKRGIKVEIRILDGTIIDEQILVESLDLSYISITTDNPDNKVIVTPTATNWDKNSVSHDSRGNMPFFAGEHGARLPVIKCLFSCTSPMLQIEDKTIGIVGYYCNRGSMGVMAVGAAYPENTTQSGAGDIEAEVGFEGFYDCVIANNNSEIVLRECIARNAGRYGIMSRHISRISARSADLTNCGTIINEKVKNNETLTTTEKETTSAAYADRSSMMDVRFADVSGSYNGIQSFNTSNATAVETIANNITNIVADARAGSIINCDSMTIDNVKDVFKVTKGGSIVANGAKLSNVTGATYNVTTDIYTSNGSIYVTANKESVSSGSSSGGNGITEAQKQTLLAVINAIGLFNVDNAQTLLDNFNKAWNTVDPVPATSITLDKTAITFTTEETQTIIASVLPANTTDVVVWTSSNNTVATVKNGVVTPLVDGETVITATAGNVSATCAVTVNMFGDIENAVFVSSGTIGKSSTATSEPTANTDYPNSVTFSAIPVKAGTLLICNTNITKQKDWVYFFNYDNDGVNCEQIWFTDNTAGTVNVKKDGFIRVCIMRQASHTFTTDTVTELSTTTNGVKTTYTLVDRR